MNVVRQTVPFLGEVIVKIKLRTGCDLRTVLLRHEGELRLAVRGEDIARALQAVMSHRDFRGRPGTRLKARINDLRSDELAQALVKQVMRRNHELDRGLELAFDIFLKELAPSYNQMLLAN
jgi:hypothetical protein